MNNTSITEKLKTLLFNPVNLAILFVLLFVFTASGNPTLIRYVPPIFLLIAFSPFLYEFVQASWPERFGFLLVLYVIFNTIF